MTGSTWNLSQEEAPSPDSICITDGFYDVLTDRSLSSSKRSNKQLTKTDLHPTKGQQMGIPVVELGKGWKKLRRRATP